MKLIIDLTDVLGFFQVHWTVTGIQRVSLRLAKLLREKQSEGHDILVMAMDAQGRGIIGDVRFLEGTASVDRERFLAAFRLPDPPPPEPEDRRHQKRKRRGPAAMLRRIRRKLRGRAEPKAVLVEPGPTAPAPLEGSPLTAEHLEGATVLVLGGVRPIPDYWEKFDEWRRTASFEIVMMIHDLIPLVRPEFVADDQPPIFYEALHRCSRSVERFITPSEYVKGNLAAFQRAFGYEGKTITAVPLAHEYIPPERPDTSADDPERPPPPRPVDFGEPAGLPYGEVMNLRRDVRMCWSRRYVLTVGTIEPRKNFFRLCQAWQRVLEELGPEATPHLVLAGKKSYGSEDFDAFLARTRRLDGHILIVDAPSDEELAFLFRRCLFTVYPSSAEGWGLPVGESIWWGKPCVATRASSVPEVGGAACDYFDPDSIEDMHRVIAAAIREPDRIRAQVEAVGRENLRTWADVAESVWGAVRRSDARPPTAKVEYRPGTMARPRAS